MADAVAGASVIDDLSTGPGPRRVSPAAHLAEAFAAGEVTGPRGVGLRELPFTTMVGLRAVPGTPAADALGTSLGTPLPTGVGDVASAVGASVLWLAPDEFLAVCEGEPVGTAHVLRAALGDEPGSVVDLSANRTTFELAGPSARAVLEKGCSLDLHPRVFAVGSAYVTVIGSVPAIVWRTRQDAYRILPRASFADFLGRWLLDAMAEFKVPEIA